MDTIALKDELIKISTLFYQEKTSEGMNEFMGTIGTAMRLPEFSIFINPLFDALESEDYVLVADILHHEIAMKL